MSSEASAGSITFEATNTSLGLSASATFEVSGDSLTVTLTNTSKGDVLVPSDVLTAVFFTVAGDPELKPVSAVLAGGSNVLFGSTDPGGVVGGEWAYKNGLSGAPQGADEGISSSGLGLFGPSNLFPGSDLDNPTDPNGLNYGITSAGDNSATGNKMVTESEPLIKNSVVFTLSGLSGFRFEGPLVTNVSFQYGTDLSGPNLPIPEPATMLLFGSGLLGLAAVGRKRFFKGA